MRILGKFLKWFLIIFVLYVGGILVYGTVTDWVPEPYEELTAVSEGKPEPVITDSLLTFMTWNVGFGGLGEAESFFYDEGDFFWTEMGHARAKQENVEGYVNGQEGTIKAIPADFYLLQEVDTSSRRSWYTNQLDSMHAQRPDYAASFAMNYKNERVPIPVFQPWDHYGYVRGGVASLTKYQPSISERHQLPGDLDWPTRLFELDRCALRQVFPTQWGKDLVVYNVHLAAYDKGGAVKSQQMAWLRERAITDYEAGHYVVIGGDWNQVPPGVDYGSFSPERRDEFSQIAIDFEYAPEGWVFAYDAATPTNRKTKEVYDDKKALKALIDFYLISPNVIVRKVRGMNQSFAYSDHQPVLLEVELRK